MKIIKLFLLTGLFIGVVYTLFAIQNNISIPVRLTFGEPKVYFLPLIVLLSFIFGGISGSIFILFYQLVFKNNVFKNNQADICDTENQSNNKSSDLTQP